MLTNDVSQVVWLLSLPHYILAATGLVAILCLPPDSPLGLLLLMPVGKFLHWLVNIFTSTFTNRNSSDSKIDCEGKHEASASEIDTTLSANAPLDDKGICSICLEPMKFTELVYDTAQPQGNQNPHRPAYLMMCGHVFGHECIDHFLQYESENCPTCGQRATFLHIYDVQ